MLFKLLLLIMIFIILTLSICILFKKESSKENLTILIGNPLDKKINVEYDDTFTNEFINSNYLLKLIENDASKSVDGKLVKLTSLIKKANIIILNIGEFEINSLIDNNQNNYDVQIIDRTIDIYLNNLNAILNKIEDINDDSLIYVCNITYPLSNYDDTLSTVYKTLNESINEIVKKNNANILR